MINHFTKSSLSWHTSVVVGCCPNNDTIFTTNHLLKTKNYCNIRFDIFFASLRLSNCNSSYTALVKVFIHGKWYFRMVFGTFLSLGRSVEFFKFCHFQLYLLCIEKIDFKSTIICHFEKNQIQSFQTLPDPVSQLPTSADISPSLIDLDLYRHCLTIFIQMMIMTADLRLQWSCR